MMDDEKYNPISMPISGLLGNIEAHDIAIPEIQRPFVWKKSQVRDLLDSLYKGYPTGYLIIWKSPNVKLKDGSMSSGKKILIDGQQRVTALMTAVAGFDIVDANYNKGRIKISFNPYAAISDDPDATIFEVQSGAIAKDKRWIQDIADVFKPDFSQLRFVKKYCQDYPDMNDEKLADALTQLTDIKNRRIGVIELAESLDIDVVTDIFIRINSNGTSLSQGDFVMSKIASDEDHGGNMLRKTIDYFAHLSVDPQHYDTIGLNDKEFATSEYFPKLEWLKHDNETVYDPECDDVLRVAFMSMYPRAKLSDLVSLLSGRDFDERTYKAEIVEDTYEKLKTGVLKVINEDNFKNFMIAIRSAGFVSSKLVNSQMAIDFAYMLYLRLKDTKEADISQIKRLVARWYVFSILTGRYSNSPESAFYADIRKITEIGVAEALKEMEDATLSENFWANQVPMNLDNTSSTNPTLQVYLAAQVYLNDISLLSNSTTVRDLIEIFGDIHHIFPKAYLKKNGFDKQLYNQNGNFAFLDTQVNKGISDDAPNIYFPKAFKQCETKIIECGSITDQKLLKQNLQANCIPDGIEAMDFHDYESFLKQRRSLMAQKIRHYYESL
jgi:hypothetical protein